jgi:hypothetical protein
MCRGWVTLVTFLAGRLSTDGPGPCADTVAALKRHANDNAIVVNSFELKKYGFFINEWLTHTLRSGSFDYIFDRL